MNPDKSGRFNRADRAAPFRVRRRRDEHDGCNTHDNTTYPPVDNYPGRDNQETS
jgi:hypothetical protein